MQLRFGNAVVGNDDAVVGRLERVLVDPVTREITHVVVRAESLSEEVLLPLSLVQGNTDSKLLLLAAGGDLQNMPRYYEGRSGAPPTERVDFSVVREAPESDRLLRAAEAVPEGALELSPETRVVATEGAEGRLVGLAADQYVNHIAELHVEGWRDDEAAVPGDRIGELVPEAIRVNLSAAEAGRHARSAVST